VQAHGIERSVLQDQELVSPYSMLKEAPEELQIRPDVVTLSA
jgi:hypothetical protein